MQRHPDPNPEPNNAHNLAALEEVRAKYPDTTIFFDEYGAQVQFLEPVDEGSRGPILQDISEILGGIDVSEYQVEDTAQRDANAELAEHANIIQDIRLKYPDVVVLNEPSETILHFPLGYSPEEKSEIRRYVENLYYSSLNDNLKYQSVTSDEDTGNLGYEFGVPTNDDADAFVAKYAVPTPDYFDDDDEDAEDLDELVEAELDDLKPRRYESIWELAVSLRNEGHDEKADALFEALEEAGYDGPEGAPASDTEFFDDSDGDINEDPEYRQLPHPAQILSYEEIARVREGLRVRPGPRTHQGASPEYRGMAHMRAPTYAPRRGRGRLNQ